MASPRVIYFDYNATTPLDARVLAVMRRCLEDVHGNPSSLHSVGRQARALLDEARERVAAVFRCGPSEIVFTSGGTESNNLAILGAARQLRHKGRHLITSAVEHPAVLRCFEYLAEAEGFVLAKLPVDRYGRVAPDDLLRSLRPDTILVSVMAANNETGSLQPVADLGQLCRDRGILFHTDAVQWFGKMPCDSVETFHADLVSLCGHKLHGPKGVGVLYIRSPNQLQPILHGGSHEHDRRAGTENLAAIVGLANAVERFVRTPVFPSAPLRDLTGRLAASVRTMEGVQLQAPEDDRLPNTVSLTVAGTESVSLLAALDLEGICASGGSACSSGALQPSHVLLAMGVERRLASALLRLSLGRDSTPEQVERFTGVFPRLVERILATR